LKIIVTGGSGFVGSAMVSKLKMEGHDVLSYDIKDNYDILNAYQLKDVINDFKPDQIYHMCAQAFLKPGELNPEMDMKINELGMVNLLKAIEDTKIPMVYTSSGAVYGLSVVPHSEDVMCVPVSNYGISKYAAEQYLRKWVITKNVNAKIIRFSSVYGANRTEGPVNIFINKSRKGESLTVYGDGKQTRDMIYVDDALDALELVMKKSVRGETYNIGTGVESSVLDVAKIISCLTGAIIEFVPYEMSAFDLKRSWYDTTKIQKLGFKSRFNLERGIRETMRKMR
jgi:nucleoside-diphosphate-sugar epimerase